MPIPSVNCAFVLDDYRFRVRGSPHTIIHFLFFSLLSDLKFFLLRFGIRSTSTYSVQFSLLQSNSVYFVQFSPIRSIFPFWSISRRKWAFAFFAKTFQQNTPYLKLIRKMPPFWNLIFGQLSYSKLKNFKNFFFSGTRVSWTWVPCEVLEFPNFFFLPKSTFTITRCSKNRVLHLELDFLIGVFP